MNRRERLRGMLKLLPHDASTETYIVRHIEGDCKVMF